jgi:hypothetical protein
MEGDAIMGLGHLTNNATARPRVDIVQAVAVNHQCVPGMRRVVRPHDRLRPVRRHPHHNRQALSHQILREEPGPRTQHADRLRHRDRRPTLRHYRMRRVDRQFIRDHRVYIFVTRNSGIDAVPHVRDGLESGTIAAAIGRDWIRRAS